MAQNRRRTIRSGARNVPCLLITSTSGFFTAGTDKSNQRTVPVIMFPGGLQWHQGLDIAIRAMVIVGEKMPAAEFHIYGSGNMKDSLVELTAPPGLDGQTFGFLIHCRCHRIAEVMSQADLGVVPKRADSFGNEAYSTKIMEFMSLGVPVVVSNTKIDLFYFSDSTVRFFESGNHVALAAAIVELLQDDSLRRRLAANALDYASKNSWNVRKKDYLELVDSLIEKRPLNQAGAAVPEAIAPVSSDRETLVAVKD